VDWELARADKGNIAIRDDLRSEGFLGLVQAARRYDPSRGVLFKTFACYRIRGQMQDYLRRLNLVHRGAFARGERCEFISLDAVEAPDEMLAASGWCVSQPSDAWSDVETAMRVLTYRSKEMIMLYYFEGWTQRMIGDRYGMTASRVSQILIRAREEMRQCLTGSED